ncbi:MAG: hypothetical protein SGJ27_15955, partial [Candidatus Melainabacteria bacterium]|nr:hypothetical protein [Candidatus Melainabacteria bacterium]
KEKERLSSSTAFPFSSGIILAAVFMRYLTAANTGANTNSGHGLCRAKTGALSSALQTTALVGRDSLILRRRLVHGKGK